jgi:uncharacterized protein (DUF1330 family)
MPVHAVFTYDITDPERYAKYNPGNLAIVGSTIARHGGSIVFAGPATYLDGESKMANVCLCFPTQEAFTHWSNDPEYVAIKSDRIEASNNYTVFLVES